MVLLLHSSFSYPKWVCTCIPYPCSCAKAPRLAHLVFCHYQGRHEVGQGKRTAPLYEFSCYQALFIVLAMLIM